MCNMLGIGQFIAIPLLMSALNGPKAMLGSHLYRDRDPRRHGLERTGSRHAWLRWQLYLPAGTRGSLTLRPLIGA